jgi:hypothetical protein
MQVSRPAQVLLSPVSEGPDEGKEIVSETEVKWIGKR